MSTSETFEEFLTLPAYEYLVQPAVTSPDT